jgi:predicted permease
MIHYLRALWARLRGLFGDRKAEREFDDEIRAHLESLAERYVRQGMAQDEAARAARRQFGNATLLKETHRDMRGIRFIETLFQDLRYGLRVLGKNPGITFVAVLTLALGIGANTAIFSVVNAVLLRPLPYRDPDRLVLVTYYRGITNEQTWGTDFLAWRDQGTTFTSGADFLAWRDQAKAFEQIAASWTGAGSYRRTIDLTGNREPERLAAGYVSADLFATLGIAPALGRPFTPAEDRMGGEPVVILSDSLWRRRFGGDPQVIGRALVLGGQSRTVVGVMPPGFHFPGESDLWLPLTLNVTQGSRSGQGIAVNVIARLKPGVTQKAAGADLSVILNQQRQAFPNDYADVQIRVIGLNEWLVGKVRLALLVLLGAVVFVLLIACVNVANLLLARSAARQKEMVIRAAVGAGRLRLVRQLLTESLLLSAVGGAAGLLVAMWGVKLLVAVSPAGIARIQESNVDGRVLGFTCLVVVLTGLIAGIFPALQASKTDVNETLKAQSGAMGAQWRHGSGLRTLPVLMIAELALALVLLVGAGLMVKSFLRLLAVPKGFNPDGVLTLGLLPNRNKYPLRSPQRNAYYQEVLARVQALPGVESAGLTGFLPLTGPTISIGPIRWQDDGYPPSERETEIDSDANLNHVTPGYFQTMGIEMRAGRAFVAQDGNKAAQVAIINETAARLLFQNKDPIGHSLFIGPNPKTIVGVAGDTRHFGLDQEVQVEVYLPNHQPIFDDVDAVNYVTYSTLAVRVAAAQNSPIGLSSLAAAIRNQVRAIDPSEPVSQIVTMDERMSNSVAQRRFQMLLLGAFATVALIIATVGIYGVISYAVSQRTHEIGIRMALGAQASDVLRMVIWRGMSLALIGVALGLGAALALTRVMKNLLYDVSATDPATFSLIALLLVGVALIASYIPARRATKIDPLQALRHE